MADHVAMGLFRHMADWLAGRTPARLSAAEAGRIFQSIANYTHDWESWIGAEGRPRWINPGVERITGYRVEECMAMADYPLPLVHPEDRAAIAACMRSAGHGDSGNDVAFRLLRKDGSTRWGAMSWQTLYHHAGLPLGFRTSIRDISERKQVEDELRAAHGEAERANLAKSRFLAAASHDLRQPLQAVTMFVAALKARGGGGDALDIIRSIQASLRATNDLLDALLDVSRLDAGVLQPKPRPIPVVDLVERIADEFAPQAADRALRFRAFPIAATIETDPALLDRVLTNLVSNAMRYTEKGGVLLGCRLRGDRLRFEVWDTGIGIPADEIGRIFEEFYQIGNPERDRTRGLGLGLTIVDRMARLLGYRIFVRSIPGRGSCFAVEVPLAGTPERRNDARVPRGIAGSFLLAIDDEPVQRKAMELLFRQWGCEVLTAGSADEALAKLAWAARPLDAIVADYRLRDGVTGAQAIARIRQALHRPVPALLLTGDTEPARLIEAKASGFDLMHKPVDPARLLANLRQAIDRVA
ncbi:MAG: ATP-binding protein [Dongiaceae bacterium]